MKSLSRRHRSLALLAFLSVSTVPSVAAAALAPPASAVDLDVGGATPLIEVGKTEVGRAILEARSSELDAARLRERLRDLSKASLPMLLDTYLRGNFDVRVGERGNSVRRLTTTEEHALLEALARSDWSQLRALIVERGSTDALSTTLPRALDVIGRCGHAADALLMIDLVEPDEDAQRVARELRARLESSLADLLARRGNAADFVVERCARTNLSLVQPLLAALASAANGERLNALTRLLGEVPDADALILTEAGRVAEHMQSRPSASASRQVRRFLDGTDVQTLSTAIVAIEQMDDLGAVASLIELLKHESSSVRDLARTALQSITYEKARMSHSDWSEWHAAELAWWSGRAEQQLKELHSQVPGARSRAILELAQRRLFRHEVAAELCAVLNADNEELVLMTCAALGNLRSVEAVPSLLAKLGETSVSVRRAAFLALCRVTGENHGEDPSEWRAAGWDSKVEIG